MMVNNTIRNLAGLNGFLIAMIMWTTLIRHIYETLFLYIYTSSLDVHNFDHGNLTQMSGYYQVFCYNHNSYKPVLKFSLNRFTFDISRIICLYLPTSTLLIVLIYFCYVCNFHLFRRSYSLIFCLDV